MDFARVPVILTENDITFHLPPGTHLNIVEGDMPRFIIRLVEDEDGKPVLDEFGSPTFVSDLSHLIKHKH